MNFEIDNNYEDITLSKQNNFDKALNSMNDFILKYISNTNIFVKPLNLEKNRKIINIISDDKQYIFSFNNSDIYNKTVENFQNKEQILNIIKINNINLKTVNIDLFFDPHKASPYFFDYSVLVDILGEICKNTKEFNENNDCGIKLVLNNVYIFDCIGHNAVLTFDTNNFIKYYNMLPKHLDVINCGISTFYDNLEGLDNLENFNTKTECNIAKGINLESRNAESITYQNLSDDELSKILLYLKNNGFTVFYCLGITSKMFKRYFYVQGTDDYKEYLHNHDVTATIIKNALKVGEALKPFELKGKTSQDRRLGFQYKIEKHCLPKRLTNMNETQIYYYGIQLICEFAILLCLLHQPFNEEYFKYKISKRNATAYLTYHINETNTLTYLWVLITKKDIFKIPENEIYEIAKNFYNFYLDNYIYD